MSAPRSIGRSPLELAPYLESRGLRMDHHGDVQEGPLSNEWGAGVFPSLADLWRQRITVVHCTAFLHEDREPLEMTVVRLENEGFIVLHAASTVHTNNRPQISMFDGLVGVDRGMLDVTISLKLLELWQEEE